MRKASGFLALILAVSISAQATLPSAGPATDRVVSKPEYEITAMLRRGEAGYFTLSPSHSFVGPVFTENTTSEYVKEVFGLLIQAADSMASEYYKDNFNDNFTYWSFLVAALTVPHHESKLMHAHLRTKESNLAACTPSLNELAGIKSPRMLPVLRAEYRQDGDPIFPNCAQMKGVDSVQQLLISAVNRHDMGMMQLNGPTFVEAMKPEIYMNLFNTVRFGMYHLFGKYKDIRMNHSNYPCLTETNILGGKGTRGSSFYNLVRGTWGGGYNIGNTLVASVCRFANSGNPDHIKDVNFKKHLDSLVLYDNSIFHRYLPAGSKERKALDEIVFNFRAAFTTEVEKERNANVRAVVEEDYFSKYMADYNRSKSLNPRYYLNTKNLYFRSVPMKDSKYICGVVHGSGVDKKPSLHVERFWRYSNPFIKNREEAWAAVRLSQYANNVEFTSNDPKCISGNRDMFFVDGNNISEVTTKDLTNVDLVGFVQQRGRVFNIRQFYSLDSSIIGQIRSGETVDIVAIINDKVKVRDIQTGKLKDSPFKWYKVVVPGKKDQFGYVNETAFENVRERN